MQCEQQPWPRLLALSCLSLAAKMQRVATFSIDEIQVQDFGASCLRFGERLLWILTPKLPVFLCCGCLVLQRDEDFMFDAATVRRMERWVLGVLEWRARSVTPLAFLGFFLSACYPPPRHPPQVAAVKARAVDLLLCAQPGTCAAHALPCPMPWHGIRDKRNPNIVSMWLY